MIRAIRGLLGRFRSREHSLMLILAALIGLLGDRFGAGLGHRAVGPGERVPAADAGGVRCGGGDRREFNAPVAGALFAVEVILGDFAVSEFSPIVIASVMATVVSRHYLGDVPAFEVPPETWSGSRSGRWGPTTAWTR
jgi:hypothetical protein